MDSRSMSSRFAWPDHRHIHAGEGLESAAEVKLYMARVHISSTVYLPPSLATTTTATVTVSVSTSMPVGEQW